MFFNQIMCCSYSLLLVTVFLLVILFHTSARLSHTRKKLTIDDRRESDELMERTDTKDAFHGITTHKNSPFPAATATAAARHQRQSRRRLSDTTDRTNDIDTYSDSSSSSSSFDWRIANASVSLSAFAHCANDTIVSFKVHHHRLLCPIPCSIITYCFLTITFMVHRPPSFLSPSYPIFYHQLFLPSILNDRCVIVFYYYVL